LCCWQQAGACENDHRSNPPREPTNPQERPAQGAPGGELAEADLTQAPQVPDCDVEGDLGERSIAGRISPKVQPWFSA